MICNNCKNESDDIDGLKFCPYCGAKTEESIEFDIMQAPDKIKNEGIENLIEAVAKDKKHQNTLEMPIITKKDIRKYKKEKINSFFKKIFKRKKIIVPIIALLVVISAIVFAKTFLIVKPVDEVRIKEDLIGKVVTFPKGTSIKIDKNNMKSFSINSRNTDKSTDEIKVSLILNNGVVEANTNLTLAYTSEGNNKWKFEKFVLARLTSLKPVVGMDEAKFLARLKKLKITIADTPITLGGQDVKNLGLTLRTPDFENGKEEILVATSIDSGLLSTTGKIKCELIFKNEVWSIGSIEENSTGENGINEFKLALSPTFSDDKVIETIRSGGLEENVTYPNFFEGKGFAVKDKFTNGIQIFSKKYDSQKGTLSITAKRENTAGEIKSVLSTNYNFSISLSKVSLLYGSKTTVDSGTINKIPQDVIISTITNNEIEGSNLFFWWSNNHKITAEEAKTFKIKEILSKKGSENIKYVYGSITYMDKKKKENKNVSFVALYFLVYDEAKGYNWKLDKLVGEDSPNYASYSKEVINQ
ncbi:MAG TPA: hypothetical protein VIM70_02515 [Clostridium sp.]|uniref:hypothetical protein n=1 Tax=Clostridium sp. TaxID=1506 RepID=UPI002F91C074